MTYASPPGFITYAYSASSACDTMRLRWFLRLKCGSAKQKKSLDNCSLAKKLGMKRIALFLSAHTFSKVGAFAAAAAAEAAETSFGAAAAFAAAAIVNLRASSRRASVLCCTYWTTFSRISMPRIGVCG